MSPENSEEKAAIFHLDEVQSNFYKLLTLFYSGIGIIQRDAPARNERENPDALLRLENNIKEIIGQFITTKEKLKVRIEEIEGRTEEFSQLGALIEETRELDEVLLEKVALLEAELPLLKEEVNRLADEVCRM
ncbi:uncharacterized protein NEMAJ01_0772 [Nematocida major]|uniref:uncharacterized protein n=1 Tax=Nematocida major TaxID=1912982 RepID=UPI002008E87F|nr:uncharacterized protein NEMAJ01_0772 [Nematocida major]KAH9385876.1 hypothetical protein NEMAJ01_0772 [Nematocida major]